MTKQKLLDIMVPEIQEIVSTWDKEGIIIEAQFSFASSSTMERFYGLVYEIIVEYGGHSIGTIIQHHENEQDEELINQPLILGLCCDNEGYMYCFYDPYFLEYEEAGQAVKKYMHKHPSFKI